RRASVLLPARRPVDADAILPGVEAQAAGAVVVAHAEQGHRVSESAWIRPPKHVLRAPRERPQGVPDIAVGAIADRQCGLLDPVEERLGEGAGHGALLDD